MPTGKKNIHRGEILAQLAAKTDLSIIQIARRAGYKTRGSFYDHVKNPNLPYTILERYAKVFDHDFSEEIAGMPKLMLEEPVSPYAAKPKTIEEAENVISEWREKYYALLEKYNASLEREKELNDYINEPQKKE